MISKKRCMRGCGVDTDARALSRARRLAADVRDWLDARERQYIEVYRDVLRFAYLVLAR